MLGCGAGLGNNDFNELAHLILVGRDDGGGSENFLALLRRQLCELLLGEAASAQIDLHLVGHKRTDAGHDVAPVRAAFSLSIRAITARLFLTSSRSSAVTVATGTRDVETVITEMPSVPTFTFKLSAASS